VDDDAREPGHHLGLAAKLAAVAIGLEVGLLQGVLGFGRVLEDRAGDAKQAAVVPPHQDFEGRVLVPRDALDEPYVVEGAESGESGRAGLYAHWEPHSLPPRDAGRGPDVPAV